MLEDSRAAVLLTENKLLGAFPETGSGQPVAGIQNPKSEIQNRFVVCLDRDWEKIACESEAAPVSEVTAENLAYVIYTSGSTGTPKGVLIAHYNVTRLLEATNSWFHFDQNDVWTLFHSYAFDFSVWEMWGSLLHGGRLVVVPDCVRQSPEMFYKLLAKEGVTVLNQTPSAFCQLIQAETSLMHSLELALRLVIFGGEALDFHSLRPWFDRHGDQCPQLVNMYGITETTVHVTYRPITAADVSAGIGSLIGMPIPDLELYVLDQNHNPVPIGVPGELHVGGPGVGRGYLNRPELTGERFIPNPFRPGARLYRSGDMVRYLFNRDVEYLGRIDSQVKIRGFRIELREIETVLSQNVAVAETVVLARQDHAQETRLVAYVVLNQASAATASELRSFLKSKLPDYMIPSAFVFLDALPLTSNGKVNKLKLPAPDHGRPEQERPFVAPRTPVEEVLARIWAEVLKLEQVGVDDNFFDLGGHSLLATQVMSRLQRALQVELPLRNLFELPTVAGLAERIETALWAAKNHQTTSSGNLRGREKIKL
jgi:amino acid adenylation domain-containing protein